MSFLKNNSQIFSPQIQKITSLSKSHVLIQPQLEDAVARELQQRKLEEERRNKLIARVCNESSEIKTLKQKIQCAYVNKERTQQIAEGQLRRIHQIKQEADWDTEMLQKREDDLNLMLKISEFKKQQLNMNKKVQQFQMLAKETSLKQQNQFFEEEKQRIDQLIKELLLDKERHIEKVKQQQLQMQKYMETDINNQQIKKQQLKQLELNEMSDLRIFQKQKQDQEQIQRKRLENKYFSKQTFSDRISEGVLRQKQEEEFANNLRNEYYSNQLEIVAEELQKQQNQKMKQTILELQQAEQEAKNLMVKRKNDEISHNIHYHDHLEQQLQQYKEKEQNYQHQMKEMGQKYKGQLDEFKLHKQRLYEDEKIKEQQLLRAEAEEEKEEQERLLQQHLPAIGEFAPKGFYSGSQSVRHSSMEGNKNYQQKLNLFMQ